MSWIEVGSTDMHYLERGSGEPLVLIHGALSSAETWYRHIDNFSAHHRVLAYDSVNHGLSSNSPRGEPEPDRADELERFLAATGAPRPILAGQSMGGMTILRWAIRHPAAARALIISGMGVPREPRAGVSPLQQKIGDDVLRAEGVARITSPMLIMVGSLDGLRPWAEHLHELRPSARFEVIEGAAHSAHFECFDRYVALVNEFLADQGL